MSGYLLRCPDENATGPVGELRFDAGSNQPHDLFLEQLAVAGMVFVPDHQINGETLETPVGMGLH